MVGGGSGPYLGGEGGGEEVWSSKFKGGERVGEGEGLGEYEWLGDGEGLGDGELWGEGEW